jgi:hypothetical protein
VGAAFAAAKGVNTNLVRCSSWLGGESWWNSATKEGQREKSPESNTELGGRRSQPKHWITELAENRMDMNTRVLPCLMLRMLPQKVNGGVAALVEATGSMSIHLQR